MNQADLARQLEAMLQATPGIQACALVDGDSGLIWHRCGPAVSEADDPLWEAAVDFWRLHGRHRSHFARLGDLGAAVLYHYRGVLAILPCQREPDVLVVCHADPAQRVDWRSWQLGIARLGRQLSA